MSWYEHCIITSQDDSETAGQNLMSSTGSSLDPIK
jgi:hypothetical protein